MRATGWNDWRMDGQVGLRGEYLTKTFQMSQISMIERGKWYMQKVNSSAFQGQLRNKISKTLAQDGTLEITGAIEKPECCWRDVTNKIWICSTIDKNMAEIGCFSWSLSSDRRWGTGQGMGTNRRLHLQVKPILYLKSYVSKKHGENPLNSTGPWQHFQTTGYFNYFNFLWFVWTSKPSEHHISYHNHHFLLDQG